MYDELPPRSIAPEEIDLLLALLSVSFPGCDALRQQIHNCKVRVLDDDGSLQLMPIAQSAADVRCRVPVEAVTVDSDGIPIHILLHVVDGYLNELEIYKEDLSTCLNRVTATNLQVAIAKDTDR